MQGLLERGDTVSRGVIVPPVSGPGYFRRDIGGRRRNRNLQRLGGLVGAVLLTLAILSPGSAATPAGIPSASVSAGLGTLSADFWGINYDAAIGTYTNRTVAGYVNETPFHFFRLPIQGSLSSIYPSAFTLCTWVDCGSEVTVGGPGVHPLQAAQEVRNLIDNESVKATWWAFGNEPNLWHPKVTGLQYAQDLHQFITDVRSFDPQAQFVGIEMAGQPIKLDPFLSNVTRIDGPNISMIGLHSYSQEGGTSGNLLDDFMRGLFGVASVAEAAVNARQVITAACATCHIQVAVTEINDGDAGMTVYNPYRQGYPEEVFIAGAAVQALTSNVSPFAPWTLTALADLKCDIGMIELNARCDGITRTVNPAFYFFSTLAPMLPIGGTIYKVVVPHQLYTFAAEVANATVSRLLVVNANPSENATFSLDLSPAKIRGSPPTSSPTPRGPSPFRRRSLRTTSSCPL